MKQIRNIVLTGFMGTGKTTAGKLAAKALNVPFVDIDKEIINQEGMSIPEIFTSKGEAYFRSVERQVIEAYSRTAGSIIATGGGAVMDVTNVSNLRKTGIIVYLKSTPEIIFRNTSKRPGSRPLLQTEDPVSSIHELLQKREEYYNNHDTMIDVSELTLEEVVEKVIGIYKNTNGE